MARVPFSLLQEPETRKPSKVRLLLFLLFLLLLVLSVVFTTLYAIERNKSSEEAKHERANGTVAPSPSNGTNSTTARPTASTTLTPRPSTTGPTPTTNKNSSTQSKTCSSPSCVISAADILNKLDESTDPCDDFYQFSCGGYIKKTHLREGQAVANSFSVAGDRIQYSLRDLLQNEQLMSNYSEDLNSAVYKAFTFYKSCMNDSAIESAGIKPIRDLIERYGSWNITNENWNGDSWKLEKILARVVIDLETPAFLRVGVAQSFFNNSEVYIAIAGGTTGHSDRQVNNKKSHPKARPRAKAGASQEDHTRDYKTFMSTAFKLLGSNSSINEEVKRIVALEEEFKTYADSSGPVDTSNAEAVRKNIKFFTLRELNNITSFKFNWTTYFGEVFNGTNQSITSDQKLMVVQPDKIKKIVDWITTKPKSLLANEIIWNVVRTLINTLPEQFVEASKKYSKGRYIENEAKPRWKLCNSLTDKAFTFVTTLLYVNEHLPEEARETAGELFTEIKGQFIEGLKKQTWMDDATRAHARLKLNKMKEWIGFPSFIKDPAKLNEYYENIQVWPFRLLESQVNVIRELALREINELGKPRDPSRFSGTPLDVNANYNSLSNGITILAGILQPPFYKYDRLKALNYGSLGMVVGHEITHGFDKTGSEYDENGNLRSWWSKKSHKNFVERSTCLIEQYNKVKIFGYKVDGNKTLSENIADNGGLKYAFRAYQKWRETHGDEEKLPALPFNNDQLFFVGFAQLWCSKYKKEIVKALMDSDTHSLGPVRVRVPLFNFPEFSKAFGCPAPNNTCAVW